MLNGRWQYWYDFGGKRLVANFENGLRSGDWKWYFSDGSVRVWVDSELALDHWQPHGATVDYASIGPGTHTIRVRYLQVEGWTEIRTEIVRGSSRSPGSAGPH